MTNTEPTDLENQDALRSAVLDTEERAARFDSILGAIRDFAKGRPQAEVWEEIVRTALHDEDDADPANDPLPPHTVADLVKHALEVAYSAGLTAGIEINAGTIELLGEAMHDAYLATLRPGGVSEAADILSVALGHDGAPKDSEDNE